MTMMAKTPNGYKKIRKIFAGETLIDKVLDKDGNVLYALDKELTGVPPLTFIGKAETALRNYRIYGNTETKQRDYSGSSPLTVPVYDGELYNYRIYGSTVNGESVGEFVTEGEHVGEYAIPIQVENSAATIYLPEPIKMVGNEPEYVDYYSQTLHRVRKNLLQNITISRTMSTGITITVNDNKSVVINGTSSTGNASGIILGGNVILDKGTYILSGCPQGGSNNTYKLYCIFDDDGERKVLVDIGDGATIVLNGDNPKVVDNGFYIYALSCDNNVFYPMLRKADISDDAYEPYIETLDVPITVPALPISTGTNTVTVNTTVQPSSVEVSTDENVSVGDLVTSGQHAGEYVVPVTVEGKNLLQNKATSKTTNGVTFTVNSDGSVTCNGTASDTTWFVLNNSFDIYAPDGRIASIGNNGSSSTFYMNISYVGNVTSSVNFSKTIHQNAYVQLVIVAGYTCDNLTIYPMIRKADIEDDTYEPYHAPVTTPIYLPEPIKRVEDEAEYIDYGGRKLHKARKNLLQNTATSQTVNGITFTVNIDGSITCSGILTSGEYADLVISGVFLGDTDILENENYVVSCANASNDASLLVGNSEGEVGRAKAAEINISANLTWAMLRIRRAVPAITLYPMIRKADIEDDTYEPYIENTDLDVTLPALPTIKGTNTMSVDTEVQPSRMDIKGRIKSLT